MARVRFLRGVDFGGDFLVLMSMSWVISNKLFSVFEVVFCFFNYKVDIIIFIFWVCCEG